MSLHGGICYSPMNLAKLRAFGPGGRCQLFGADSELGQPGVIIALQQPIGVVRTRPTRQLLDHFAMVMTWL